MSTEAHILAIGKYGKDIGHCLDYHADFYKDTAPDSIVTTELFHCITRDSSSDLAEMMGVEMWNFNTYYKSNKYVKLDNVLWGIFINSYGSEYINEKKRFIELKASGFDFIYMLSA